MAYLIQLVIPLLIALFFYIFSEQKITFLEFLAHTLIQVAIVIMFVALINYSNKHDTEIWNGYVINKERVRTSCSHSYSCNCHSICSGSGNSRKCQKICATCYRHSYDISWRVFNNIGERFDISRLDSQGLLEPPRWTSVNNNDTTATAHAYINYIKSSPDTLFRKQGLTEKYEKYLPQYPSNVFDYYRLNRVVLINNPGDYSSWDTTLSEVNSKLGTIKQVNIVLVFVNELPSEFSQALAQHWLGGKKNDVIVIFGLKNRQLNWADVLAWTDSEIFKIKLRDAMLSNTSLNKEVFFNSLTAIVQKYYIRKPMEDFKYLSENFTPSVTEMIVVQVLGILTSLGLGLYLRKNN